MERPNENTATANNMVATRLLATASALRKENMFLLFIFLLLALGTAMKWHLFGQLIAESVAAMAADQLSLRVTILLKFNNPNRCFQHSP